MRMPSLGQLTVLTQEQLIIELGSSITNVCGVLLSNEVTANQMIAEALNNVAKGYVSYVGNPKLMNNVMADIEIMIPTHAEEREKLSVFFRNLDTLITLHQCE